MPQVSESKTVEESMVVSVPLTLQRRSIFKRTGSRPKASEELTHVLQFVEALRTRIRDRELNPVRRHSKNRSVLQVKRLARTGIRRSLAPGEITAPVSQAEQVEIGDAVTELTPSDSAADSAEDIAAPAGIERPNASVQAEDSGHRKAESIALRIVLGLLLLCAAVFVWARERPISANNNPATQISQPPAPADRSVDALVSDAALKVANLAIDAIEKGDFAKASGLLDEAQRENLSWPDMDYQGALLALSQGNVESAARWIDRSIAARQSVAECLYLRANQDAATGNYQLAAQSFQEAARLTPFNPRYFFFWAECLRRNGNPSLAITQFEQALRCRPSSVDTELILFKMHLARIETGSDIGFQAQLQSKLSHPPVAGDTLLLAAAEEINEGNTAASQEYIRKAAQVLPSATLEQRLRDFVFKTQLPPTQTAELRPVSGSAPATGATRPVRRRVLIDPATRSMADADPGDW